MNPDCLRLVLLNDAAAWRRFVATVAGVAVGVTLLFTLLGAHAGLVARDARTGWMNWMNWENRPAMDGAGQAVPLADGTALVSVRIDVFRGEQLWQLDVAVTPSSHVTLPTGLALPPAGQSLVSPALARLIDQVPPDQLGDRFGALAGELPASLLTGPDSLVVIHGTGEAVLRARVNVWLVDGFNGGGQHSTTGTYSMMLIIGAIALIIPVVLLVSIVTQLGAAQRRERLQTLRLLGATPGTVAGLSAAEMALMTAVGSVTGWGLFHLTRPLASQIRVDTTGFYPSDLTVAPGTAVLVAVLVVAVATATAAWRVTREGIGPLGVTRQRREKVPGLVRLVPLVAGLGFILVGAFASLEATDPRQYLAIGAFTLTAAGIIAAGPVLVHRLSGTLARRARSASALVAAGWFRRHPAAAFRSVSGLVIAVFLVTVFAGMASVATPALRPTERPGLMSAATARADLAAGVDPERLVAQLGQVDGVTGVIVGSVDSSVDPTAPGGPTTPVVVSGAEARALGLSAGSDAGCVTFDDFYFTLPAATKAVATAPVDCAARGEPATVYVITDGTPAALERAQTAAARNPALVTSLSTRAERAGVEAVGAIETLATMAYLGVIIAVVIAGISLAVSSAAAVIDNRRSFSLMRLMGMPVALLRKVTASQALVPLLLTIVGTILTGFAVAWALITGWGRDLTLSWPDPRYYLALAAATLVAALAVVATFPIVTKTTATQATRFE